MWPQAQCKWRGWLSLCLVRPQAVAPMKHHTTLAVSFRCFLALVSPAIAQKPTPSPTSSATKPPFQMPDMSAMYSQMMSAYTDKSEPRASYAAITGGVISLVRP